MKKVNPTGKRAVKKSSTVKQNNSSVLKADQFLRQLEALKVKGGIEKAKRYFRDDLPSTKFIGVKMADLFRLSKQFMALTIPQIEQLLKSDYYEARMGAVSIMDFQARDKKTTPERKKELFNLYMKRHDYINNWDLVDRSAPYVVGGYLYDKPRLILYKLARSKNVWERRTAIVSTYFFIRLNDVDDTYKIASMLVRDEHDLIHKAVGSWIREAGKKNRQKLIGFLDTYIAIMPAVMLRYAIEKLDKAEKERYLNHHKRNAKEK